jgi:hypothetical protein
MPWNVIVQVACQVVPSVAFPASEPPALATLPVGGGSTPLTVSSPMRL